MPPKLPAPLAARVNFSANRQTLMVCVVARSDCYIAEAEAVRRPPGNPIERRIAIAWALLRGAMFPN